MKIIDIECYILKAPLDTPFAFSQGWVHQRSATLVRITSDTGLTGWGEAFAQGLEPPEISAAVIEHALKPLLIGRNPLDTQVLWYSMYNQTRDYGRKGSVIAAISAIDIALWDLAGHYYSEPVCQLLGGAFRKEVEPYATGFYRLHGQGEAERLVAEALELRAAGFKAMKIKLGFGLSDDIAVMEAIHAAVNDESVSLMVDTNHAYGLADALRLGECLERFNVRWYEEPLVPEDVDGYRELRLRLRVPIAGGENEHTAYGFASLISKRAVDIAQPDIGSCGGFTAARDIAAMAQANGIAINPHVWGSAVAQAASLQLIAALPVAHHSLFPVEPMLEYDRSAHPFRQQLIDEPLAIVDGVVAIPQKPGLGISIRMDVIDQYRSL